MKTPINNKIDFMFIWDVKNGNPNGDLDNGNLPRQDIETGKGYATDACLKRKIRDFIEITMQNQEGYDIFIKEKAILNDIIDGTMEIPEINNLMKKDRVKGKEAKTKYMCEKYFDVRTFGAMMNTTDKKDEGYKGGCGTVTGPVQLTFSESVDEIMPIEVSITRCCGTKSEKGVDDHKIGKKTMIPYGLYVCYGFVNPYFAQKRGFTQEDLDVLWNALRNMFEFRRSASNGLMSARKLFVFTHDSELGNAPAHLLFDKVHIEKKEGVIAPRSFSDYNITVDHEMPAGVVVTELF